MTSSGRRVALATLIGTSIEWYDYGIYGTASALVFNRLFFPSFDPVVGTLLSFATFGVAFVARPIGGVVFGHFGDRIGRKPILVTTLLMMGLGTALIGALPTYATIGVAAPILLVLLRIVQGLAVGGEYGGAVLMAVEHAGARRRGLYGSWVQVGSPVGLVLSNVAFLAVTQLPEAQLLSWGWRIPFLVSVVLVVVGLVVRTALDESPEFEAVIRERKRTSAPIITALREGWTQILLTAGAYIGVGVTFFVAAVFAISYASENVGFSRSEAVMFVIIANLLAVLAIPLFGTLCDRVGTRRVFIAGVVGIGVLAFPFLSLLNTGNFGAGILGYCLLFIPYSACYGAMAAFFASAYDTRAGYSGFSMGYQLGAIVGGGLAPIIATQLVSVTGTSASVGWYMMIGSGISLVCAIYLGVRRHATDVTTLPAKSKAEA